MRILIVVIAAVFLVSCAEDKAPPQAQASAAASLLGQDGLAAIPLDRTASH
jgi:PBP1b-binding outer membrane lipoprotein LpoB